MISDTETISLAAQKAAFKSEESSIDNAEPAIV